MHNKGDAHKISMSQGSRSRMGGCAAARVGWEVTVGITVHDGMSDLRQKGADDGHLRHKLRTRFGMICCQESINEPKLRGTVEFKFKKRYKIKRAAQQTTLGHLRIELLSRALIVVC